jgi:acetyl-CoA carboxylase carboxyltransferase component
MRYRFFRSDGDLCWYACILAVTHPHVANVTVTTTRSSYKRGGAHWTMCGKHIELNCILKVWAVLMDAECASVLCARIVMVTPSTRFAASTSARRANVWLLAVSV